ncbi:hypothetical protein [Pantoea stewartii]|uniref:Uncharacterized protein n=1 Tax=Pantoea stewartii subsp. stewartii DC283 TaxID=660596 RepID=H3RBK9_PANSE|nr:hypothetical protein [Pantoea stewartii]ARF48190.1 hypothetical protein DSJ_01515 [Pantoea stewartii subsp. stewartii DC283]ARF49652.1 hypothetical protein DSJ_10075 [Pantoea stewartii subsp. stewartii DC283]EHT99070.1 hypothetical protein CKS_0981 [Pantoea stewartii subsp. stewartii DC283]EHU01348.1 hypothetical protein CKS_4100 [Pantoea stewartii subsp. stewartii DC283]KAB0545265.1 hypothetical protein F7Q90_25535 [Pantoea stewartii subsp. stewartii]
MAQLTNIQIRPAQVAGSSTIRAAWDDGKTAAFTCPEEAAQIISELAVLLNNTTRQQTATADSLRRYVRGTKVKTRDNEMPEMAETKLTPEIMAVMRKIAPKYDEWALGDDARIASLDVLKLAPVEAVNAVNPRPLAEMSLADAVATMYAVADYMQANKIDPLPLTPVDRLEGINEANRKFWNRGKQS